METVGVGIIGAGAFGAAHAEALAGVLGTRLVAASARTPSRLEAFTQRFGGRAYRDYRELLADPAVDVACICLPHNLHAEATVAALETGKAVLLEKPLAPSAEECSQIVRAVAGTSVPFMLGHIYRYMPVYAAARRLIDADEIGEPVVCTAAMAKGWGFEQREAWHLTDGGGMWLTNGCHLVDRLSWLLDSRPRDIRAVVGTRFHTQDADDVGVGLLTFESGAVGVVRAVGYRLGAQDHGTEIQGTRGALRLSHSDGLFVARADRWEQVEEPTPDLQMVSLRAQWESFLGYLKRGGMSPISAEYGQMVVATILAGMESSRTGDTVRVGDVGA
ncbi:MAG: Gfo/Idh/MocA family oxidoreductase [Chloroflexota bacterium]